MSSVRREPFRTCRQAGEGELQVRGSRFIARVEPCPEPERARVRLEVIRTRYPDASHICWAWRLLGEPEPGEASSDAGEPGGTAGVPMLGVLRSNDLWNVLGVVVRWFGGTKLGRGGLIRAYREAMNLAVADALIEWVTPRVRIRVKAPWARVGEVHRILSGLGADWGRQGVENDQVLIEAAVPAKDYETLADLVSNATAGTATVTTTGEEHR